MDRAADFWKSQEATIESMFLHCDGTKIDALERPEVLSYLPDYQGKMVLDLGCGIGRYTGDFAKKAKAVTAVDLVPQFIEKNRERNQTYSNITYLCGDVRRLEFPPNSFDLIFVSAVFMYLNDADLRVLVKKLHSWLQKEGHFFFRDSCSLHEKTGLRGYAQLRTVAYYHQLMSPFFDLISTGSIQAFIKIYGNPFRRYWVYEPIRVKFWGNF